MIAARRVGGTGCFTAGFLSAALGIGFETQSEPRPGGAPSPDPVSRAIGPLTHFLWQWAAQIGIAVLVLAAVLFAVSYWLLRPPRRSA
jgi:hypothetical protein